jgi:hypothetical protein
MELLFNNNLVSEITLVARHIAPHHSPVMVRARRRRRGCRALQQGAGTE